MHIQIDFTHLETILSAILGLLQDICEGIGLYEKISVKLQ
jgi:hypothetical protein